MDGDYAMTIATRWHGSLTVREQDVITLAIHGFLPWARWVLVPLAPGHPLLILQSVEIPELAFAVVDPLVFWPQYRLPDLLPEVPGRPEDRAVFVICTLGPHPSGNLLGPVVVDRPSRSGQQVVLDAPYSVRAAFVLPSAPVVPTH